MAKTQFELVTPSQTLYSGDAEMIVCRTVSGEIAFLANHMPYIGALDPCVVRIVGPGEDTDAASTEPDIRVAVQGGFVEVKDNQVIMLADVAVMAGDVDVEAARRDEQEAAQRQTAVPGSEEEKDAEADADLRWAQVRLEAAQPA
jgi:F-type H+-transporting ATPase subunit epsilon